MPGRENDPARHHFHPVPLGGGEVREPAHPPGAGSRVEDPGIQGVRGEDRESRMKNENRKSKAENRMKRVPPSKRSAKGEAAERIANFELWFSNWVVHRD